MHIPRYLRTWLVPSPRSIVAVLFESVRRFRASLLPHTTCVRSWRSLFVRTIFVCTVPPGTILIPIEFTVPELWQLVVLSACRIFSEGLEFVENFLERVESNRTPKKKKKKKQRRGKKKTTQRKKKVRFRASLFLHTTCVGSWCNWCATVWLQNIKKTKSRQTKNQKQKAVQHPWPCQSPVDLL